MTTGYNFGSTVAEVVQRVTLAHEIGHNFGSPVSAFLDMLYVVLLSH